MNCKNCNGAMQADEARRMYVCPYCDAQEPFDNLTRDEMQEIVDDAIEDVKIENKKMVDTIVKEHKKDLKEQEKNNEFARTGMLVLLVIFGGILFIMVAMCFDLGYIPAGIVAVIQLILVIVAFCLRLNANNSGKVKYSKAATICTILPFFLVLIWLLALGISAGTEEDEKTGEKSWQSDRVYDWATEGFESKLPHLDRAHPDYAYTYESTYKVTLNDMDQAEYEDYIQACKSAGFTVESKQKEREYTAYDEEGNRLYLNYLPGQSTLYIELSDTLPMETLYWPTQGIAKEVPAPDSEKGYIATFSSDSFRVYVGDMDHEKFVRYIETCMNAGFEGRYEQNSDKFYGEKDNINLSIENQGNNILYIIIYKSK